MQVVGRACDMCELVVNSELDGVACEQCKRVFHDACAATVRAETYRAPSASAKPRKRGARKAPASTLCPTCGDDVRKATRARDRERHAQRVAGDELRRAKLANRSVRLGIAFAIFVVLRIIISGFAQR